jgi:hypothetical protein
VTLLESRVAACFLALAVFGFRTSLWLAVIALAAHGVLDFAHDRVISNPGVPPWAKPPPDPRRPAPCRMEQARGRRSDEGSLLGPAIGRSHVWASMEAARIGDPSWGQEFWLQRAAEVCRGMVQRLERGERDPRSPRAGDLRTAAERLAQSLASEHI